MRKRPRDFLAHLSACVLLLLVFGQLFLTRRVWAGCGCDKPPPAPGAVIPNVAFPGMTIKLFDSRSRFRPGDLWTVTFQNGSGAATLSGLVESRRDLTDPNGKTFTPQILLSLPQIPTGPTTIQVSREQDTLTVPADSFTVIGEPVMVTGREGKTVLRPYTTAVGADGTLYVSVGGLASVCPPMQFEAWFNRLPLRFTYGDMVIFNWQGFLIEPLTLATANHVFLAPAAPGDKESDHLGYWRHSFRRYCSDHQPGGPKEVDPQDPNWHKDGTPHVDYATLIFAINGHTEDGSALSSGPLSITLTVEHEVALTPQIAIDPQAAVTSEATDATAAPEEEGEEERVRQMQ